MDVDHGRKRSRGRSRSQSPSASSDRRRRSRKRHRSSERGSGRRRHEKRSESESPPTSGRFSRFSSEKEGTRKERGRRRSRSPRRRHSRSHSRSRSPRRVRSRSRSRSRSPRRRVSKSEEKEKREDRRPKKDVDGKGLIDEDELEQLRQSYNDRVDRLMIELQNQDLRIAENPVNLAAEMMAQVNLQKPIFVKPEAFPSTSNIAAKMKPWMDLTGSMNPPALSSSAVIHGGAPSKEQKLEKTSDHRIGRKIIHLGTTKRAY